MKKLFHILFITIFICLNSSIHGMEKPIQAYAPPLPKEIIAYIAGYCQPHEKNILMRLRKDFYECLKNRELIIRANPSTVSLYDKKRDMFKYTYVNSIAMMQFLLDNGVNVNTKNILDMTLFHIASDNKNENTMQLLVNYGADVNIPKPQIHPLHETIYKNDEAFVRTLLKLKVDPNLALTNGITPLLIASHEGYTNLVESLLYAGATVDTASKDGWTPLYAASCNGHTDVVCLLLHARATVDHAHSYGLTPLCVASYHGDTEIVKLLIDKKANVNLANNAGWTPLCAASHCGNIEVINLLLAHGAVICHALTAESTEDLLIKKGDTALDIAQKKGHTEIVKILQKSHTEIEELVQKRLTVLTPQKESPHQKKKSKSDAKEEDKTENCSIQ